MEKHKDYCTHIKNPEDGDILTRKLFDVNMRLFKTNESYETLVLSCCAHISWCSKTKKEGYKKPHGWSGANSGIPFNIIAVNRNGKTDVMINPKITSAYGNFMDGYSNCGSLTLEEPIMITRNEFIDLEYFDIMGNKVREEKVDKAHGGFTIQHEVEHNLGILITD